MKQEFSYLALSFGISLMLALLIVPEWLDKTTAIIFCIQIVVFVGIIGFLLHEPLRWSCDLYNSPCAGFFMPGE